MPSGQQRRSRRARVSAPSSRRPASPRKLAVLVLLVIASAPAASAIQGAAAAPRDRVELVERRTPTSKTFRNPDGTFATELHAAPIHYRDPGRGLRPISSRVVRAAAAGDYAWQNEANSFDVQFKSRLDDRYLRFAVGGRAFTLTLEGAAMRNATVTGSRVTYADALPGVDLRYDLSARGVKETLVLADTSAPLSYRFTLDLPDRVPVSAKRLSGGAWAFTAPAHAGPIFVLAPPTIGEGAARGAADAVSMDVRRASSGYVVELSVDGEWLRAPDRRFPVLLDPTVVLQPSVEDGNWDIRCGTCTGYAGSPIWLGGDEYSRWRGGVKFDLTDVPPGATVNSATLSLWNDVDFCIWTSSGACSTANHTINVHRMTKAWSGWDSTWNQVGWDSMTTVASTVVSGTAPSGWLNWNVKSQLANWVAGTEPNHGFLLKRATDALNSGGPGLTAGDAWEPTHAPKLVVNYTSDAVKLYKPETLHGNGADLRWSAYANPDGHAFQKFEIHRSPTASFTPSSSTLIATIGDATATSYRDTTAAPNKTFTYKVVTNGWPSNEHTVTLPDNGVASKTMQLGPETRATHVEFMTGESNCLNYGADEWMYIGRDTDGWTPRTNWFYRPLVEFDLRDVPAGATVTKADLSLYTDLMPPSHTITVNAHRVTAAWSEGSGLAECTGDGASWAQRQGGVNWATAGGDYDSTALDFVTHGPNDLSGGWDTFTITNAVQKWVSGDAPNHGLLLKVAAETPTQMGDWYAYMSDDALEPSQRPKLELSYTDGESHAQGPLVQVVAPQGVAAGTATIAATASDDGQVAKVEFFVDEVLKATDTAAPYDFAWNTATATNGDRVVKAVAHDSAGLTTTSSATVKVDNTALPATAVTSPTPSTVQGDVAVTASATDGDGISKVEFYVDGNRFGDVDTVAPYATTLKTISAPDTLDRAYDGTHALTTKAYSNTGQVATSAPVTITVGNATGTKYKAEITSSAYPQAVTYDPEKCFEATFDPATCPNGKQEKYGLDVTVKNTSAVPWAAGEIAVRSRWLSPNPADAPVTGPAVAVPALAAGATTPTPITLLIEPPQLADGVDRAQYRLQIDLFEPSTNRFFAEQGNQPLENPVIVNKALVRNALGLERYYHYTGEDVGAGMQQLVNVANGNSLLRWTPFQAPGRGLATVVDLTYNALERKCECPAGNNWSLSISSLTRFGNPIDVHPNKADEIAGRSNKYIELTDGDGTTHKFTSADGITYVEPAGVNLFLRRYSATDTTRKWALTRPDRVTFFYGAEGYPTFVRDRNGNELAFTLEATPPGEDPGGPKKRITAIRDAGGRVFQIDYYSKAEARKAHIRGKIETIVDHSGSVLRFDYYEDGNLLRLTQKGGTSADGVTVADRSFVFTYTDSPGNGPAISDPAKRKNPEPHTPSQSTRLYSVIDPRGQETRFAYLGSGDGINRWKLASFTDRAGHTTSFTYDVAAQRTTVARPLSRTSKYVYDTDGKVTSITNPKDQVTTITWTEDRQVNTVTEPGGGFADYDYNANGYLTAERVLRDRKVVADPSDDVYTRTELEYENLPVTDADGSTTDVPAKWAPPRQIPHISQLVKKTEPNGFATSDPEDFQWNFVYDARGNLQRVIEPGPGTVATRPTTMHGYDVTGNGDLRTTTDPNGNVAKFDAYDANGFPTRIEDAEAQVTRFEYDADGLLLWVQDAEHTNGTGRAEKKDKSHFFYDEFHRLVRQSTPKSTRLAPGLLIWSGADYDPNDNIAAQYAPAYGADSWTTGTKTTMEYDVMDRQTAVVQPHDPGNGDPHLAAPRTEMRYDAAGRVTSLTRPLGVKSATANDHTVEYGYDTLDRVVQETRYASDGLLANARTTFLCYDLASDLRSITLPRNAESAVNNRFTSCPAETSPDAYVPTPAAFTVKLAYLADHLAKSETKPTGDTQSVEYDLNANATATVDAEGKRQTQRYDQRDLLERTEETLFAGRTKGTVKTLFQYDKAGNLLREVTPRAVDELGETASFVGAPYVTEYTYDRVDRVTLIKHPTGGSTRQAWTHYYYDRVGRPTSVSLPVETSDRAFMARIEDRTLDKNRERRYDVVYFDTGWIESTDDPGKAIVRFDYAAEGWQEKRRGKTRAADGSVIDAPEETWTYFVSGLLKSNTDANGGLTDYVYDPNGNLDVVLDGGVDDAGEAPITAELDYNGFDELTEIRQRKRATDPWRVTTYAYDLDGNLAQRVDPKLLPNGTDERRTSTFTYDEADRLIKQIDAGGPACGDEQRIETSYLRNDWVSLEKVFKSTNACEAEASWPLRQQTGYEYFDNGQQKKQTTWQGAQSDANVAESHTLSYETDGVYINGHQTVDSFSLRGPAAGAECRAYNADPAQLCKYRYVYDARDRLIDWSLRRKDVAGNPGDLLTRIEYMLDRNTPDTDAQGNRNPADPLTGDVYSEVESGTWGGGTRTFDYDGAGRIKKLVDGSETTYYSYWQQPDASVFGCVTRTEHLQGPQMPAVCKDGVDTSGDLLDWYRLDPLDRLKVFKSLRPGATMDTSYVHDAFDRVSTESENFNGSARTTSFTYLDLTDAVVSERQTGAVQGTKSYTYDAYEQRVGLNVDEGGVKRDFTYARNVHGDISLLLNDTGSARAAYGYTPYGALDGDGTVATRGLSQGDASRSNPYNPYRFNDRRYDSGSNTIDMGARRFGPDVGRFLQQDFYRGALDDLDLSIDPLTQNRFGFAGGNPISFVETDGHRVDPGPRRTRPTYAELYRRSVRLGCQGPGSTPRESLFECQRLSLEMGRIARNMPSSMSGGWLLDFIPGIGEVKAGYECWKRPSVLTCAGAIPVGGKVVKGARILRKSSGAIADALRVARENKDVIRPYREARKLTAGHGGKIQAHHLVEARHARRWGLDPNDAPALVMSKEAHQAVTRTLRRLMPYGRTYTREEVLRAYRVAYAGHRQWLEAVERYIR